MRKGGRTRKTAKRRGLKGEKREKRKGGNGKKKTNQKGLQRRGGEKKKRRKGENARKGNKKKEVSGKRRRGKKLNEKKRKGKKANNRQKTKTGNDQIQENVEDRQSTDCIDFYSKLKQLKFDQNQLRKVKRINSTLNKLENKVNKSDTAFKNGSEFFQSCNNMEGQEIFNILRSEIILLSC